MVREGVDYVDRSNRAKRMGEVAVRPMWMRDPKPSLPPRPPSKVSVACNSANQHYVFPFETLYVHLMPFLLKFDACYYRV